MTFYYVRNIFDLLIFDNETSFEICMEMHFVFLFFLNERNITTFLFMIHLTCIVVHYVNLNSSSINKRFLNDGPVNMQSHFFQFFIYVYFNEAFVKHFMKKLFFNTSFPNSFQDVVYYRILGY